MRLLVGCGLVILAAALTAGAAAADNAEDVYFDAMTLFEDGAQASAAGDAATAETRYRTGLDRLRALRQQHPEWNPHVVEYRLRLYQAALDKLLNPAAPVPPPPGSDAVDLAQQNTALAAELAAVRGRLDEVDRLARERQAALRSAGDQLGGLRTELGKSREELSQARGDLQQAQTELAGLREKLADARETDAVLAKAQAAATRLEADLARSRDAHREATNDLAQANAELDRARQDARQRAALTAANLDLQAQLTVAHDKLAAVEKQVGILRAQDPEKLEQELAAARESLAATRTQLDQVRRDLAAARSDQQALRGELTDARRTISNSVAAAAHGDRLAAEIAAAREELATATNQVRHHLEAIGGLTNQLAAARAELDRRVAALTAATNELSAATNKVAGQTERIATLETDLGEIRTHLAQGVDALTAATNQLETVRSLETRLAETTALNAALADQLAALGADRNDWSNQWSAARADLAALREQIGQLQQEAAVVTTLTNRLAELTARNADLEQHSARTPPPAPAGAGPQPLSATDLADLRTVLLEAGAALRPAP